MDRTSLKNAQRTRLADLDAAPSVGFELSADEMRLTSGGKITAGTETDAGKGDCDVETKPNPK